MSNLDNFWHIEGRAVREPVVFPNADGSKKVKMTVACDRNFKDKKTDKYESDFVEIEGFIPADGRGPIAPVVGLIAQGDRIGVGGDIRTGKYEKDGQTYFTQVLNIQTIRLRDTKETSAAHRAAAAAKGGAPAGGPPVADAASVLAGEEL